MIIAKYTPKWAEDFLQIKTELEKVLGQSKYTIEHIGSTAVPNLDAKPIIDIDIIFSATEHDFETIKKSLELLGYFHNGNQGIEDREVFKRNGLISNVILDKIPHHLYVCPSDSKELERHILSRNHLKTNQRAKDFYQKMKYELAEKANQDRKIYTNLKEAALKDFFDTIISEERKTIGYQ